MFSARAFITPVTRATLRSQSARIPFNNRLASIRAASTISEAITKDHRELKKYYDEIVNNPDNIDHQTRYGNQFTWELARHSVAEELLIYPALEKYLGDMGKEHADHDRQEHHKVSQVTMIHPAVSNQYQVKELLKEFQNMSAADSAYVPKLKEIWSVLEHHIEEEETGDLPALEKALSSSENRGSSESLAKNFGRTKAFVPSRSHPSAGENPYLYVTHPCMSGHRSKR
jgi:hypothetical protein